MPEGDTIFEKYRVHKWAAKGKAEVAFPVKRVTERVEHRVAARKRPHRKGWKCDSTGVDGRVWELECEFFNGHEEEGVKGDELYPDELNKICDSIEVEETGTLTLATRGPVRAKFKGYQRVEQWDEIDCAAVIFTFWEDNEDSVTASSFDLPSARSVPKKLAQEATFSMEKDGAWDGDISDLNAFAAGLEDLANFPGDYIDDLETQANAVVSAVVRVESAFTNAANRANEEASTLLLKPEASKGGRLLRRIADVAKRSTTNLVGSPKIVVRTFPRDLSIFDIANFVEQDAIRLLAINPGLEDPLLIPARFPVRVFDLEP